jgi:hypothetical protein
MLSPTTAIGSGFFRQLSEGKQVAVRPLLIWDALLSEFALKADLLSACKPSLSTTMSTVQGDELVRAAVPKQKYQNQQYAGKVELQLKRQIAQVLKSAAQSVRPSFSQRPVTISCHSISRIF